MTVEELTERDKSFNQSLFTSRANNMVKKLYNSITLNELDKVDHFVSDKVFNKFKKMQEDAISVGERLIFSHVNVDTVIKDIAIVNNSYTITCNITCKYCKYYVDANGNVVRGNSTNRSTVIHIVTLCKKVGVERDSVARCFGCGTTFNINESGICPTCGRVFDLEEFDYYIESFE